MKIFKGKAFFFKSILLHIFLTFIIALVSICYWENPVYDTFINSTTNSNGSENISLVVIDDKSLDTYRWPWMRSLYAEIFEYFKENTNARVVIFDTILSGLDEKNPTSDKQFFATIKDMPNYIGGFAAATTKYDNENIGENFDKKFQNKFSINITDKRSDKNSNSIYKSLSLMPDEYFNALKNTASVNLERDITDGVVRSSNDLINYKNTYYPSISLSSYLFINQTNDITLTDNYILVDKTGLKIPTYTGMGNIKHYIKFYNLLPNSNYSHKKYSAIDIITSQRQLKQGQIPIINPHEFDNKIVIVGANGLGAEDVLETSVSVNHPGVDIHATIIDNFLKNEFMVNLPDGLNLFIIIALCIATFAIIRYLAFIPSLITLIVLAALYIVFCVICFKNNLIPLTITPLAVQLSTMIFGYSYRFILEGKNKEKIKNAMGKYLSQDIMKNVVQNIDDIKLGGKKANVTVLFADIRGFTSMSEKMTAEEVSVILNEYFSEIEPIITKYNGVINKFIGDAVMAIFGEPIQDINHPQNAVKCANAMLKKVEELQEKWLFEGKPKIEIGIGINTGEAFVGNIGSEKRLEYTVIGDMVNLASRIESYNKVYKTNLLISSSTYASVSDIVNVIRIADVTIRGKAKKMDIYEVLGLSNHD